MAQIILRHLRIAFGFHIVVPRPLLHEIGNIAKSVIPVFGMYDYINKEIDVSESMTKKLRLCPIGQQTCVQ